MTISKQTPLLQVKDLSISFALHGVKTEVLSHVTFDITAGETLALVGESGSGKSVTANAIMGLLPKSATITHGQILFNTTANATAPQYLDLAQQNPDGKTMRDIRGGSIAMVFQEPMTALSPVHRIGDQISEALFLHRPMSQKEGLSITKEVLRQVGFQDPERALRRYPFELSGGLRQRAVIAMAIICHPTLLIADEPTTALDVTLQAKILHLLKSLRDELQMSMLMITHDLGVVANTADEVVVMYHGRILEKAPREAIFNRPQHPYLKALMHAVPDMEMDPNFRLSSIHDSSHHLGPMLRPHVENDDAVGQPLLSIQHLSKSYTQTERHWLQHKVVEPVRAVQDLSLTIKRGECLGLVGESGCGKSTLLKMLMKAVTPDKGKLLYHSADKPALDILSLEGEALLRYRRKAQLVFQDPFSALSPRMSVYDILREPLQIHDIGSEPEQSELAIELMRMVGLDPRMLNRYPHSFSGGQRQRIGIARALALQPELLICDEPVSALDVSVQAQVLNLLQDLKQELGLTLFFISHNLAVVNYIADRIAVMCQGRLVEIAPRETLFKRPMHPYTQTLIAAVPHTDLNKPLAFQQLKATGGANPADWPAPFGYKNDTAPALQEVEPGHYVRCHKSTL